MSEKEIFLISTLMYVIDVYAPRDHNEIATDEDSWQRIISALERYELNLVTRGNRMYRYTINWDALNALKKRYNLKE